MANYHTLLSHLLCDERYKKRCLQSVYIPCRDNLSLKSLLTSSPLPYSVDFSAVYAQVNLWKQQWGREREVIHVFYPANKRSINSERSELQENVRVSGDTARSTRVSSRVTFRDSPNGELTHRLQVFMNPYRLYCVFWKCFNKWWLGL